MKVHNYKIENNFEQAEGATCETCRKITLNGIGLLSGAQLKYIAFISMLIDIAVSVSGWWNNIGCK